MRARAATYPGSGAPGVIRGFCCRDCGHEWNEYFIFLLNHPHRDNLSDGSVFVNPRYVYMNKQCRVIGKLKDLLDQQQLYEQSDESSYQRYRAEAHSEQADKVEHALITKLLRLREGKYAQTISSD